MKIATDLGARPQFIKAAPLSRAIRTRHQEIIIHTGQHFDDNMSAVFFRELDIPKPDVQLACGGGSHARQTAAMLMGIEDVLLREKPDWVLVFGDTNSTVAGALAAAKLHIPIIHVEAGLRSLNKKMPEEINRIVTDHISRLLLCPSQAALDHLRAEGLGENAMMVGDVMADALFAACAHTGSSPVITSNGLASRKYALATIHRAENTDDKQRLFSILEGLAELGFAILLPLHPRTRHALAKFGLRLPPNIIPCDPLGHLDMIKACRDAHVILTDSGGLQKEAYWLKVPCLTLRNETEWTETVEAGWNRLVGANKSLLLSAAAQADLMRLKPHPSLYGGDGAASKRCLEAIESASP